MHSHCGVLVCGRKRVLSSGLPLTLTLSPHAGRGDVPRDTQVKTVAAALAAGPFSPPAGRRCRQADEGRRGRVGQGLGRIFALS
ncbi:hypothetical protein C7U60_02960 [Mesorhizobium plurifarium]|nr:hypothetical protein C7U60_02960 [Mesorhizobium plurifarium]